jgi:hypothetical protein
MVLQKERHPLLVCLAAVLERDRPVRAVAEARRSGKRWSFRCLRSIEQWKVTPAGKSGFVFGRNTGWKWKFYDTRSCTHVVVSREAGVYCIWDYAGMNPIEVTFARNKATLREPASGVRMEYQVEF